MSRTKQAQGHEAGPRPRARGWAAALTGSCCALAAAGAAGAQTSTDTAPERLPVAERPRPDFEARGLSVGALTYFPRLTVAPAYNDNVFATTRETTGDLVTTLRPELDVQGRLGRIDLTAFTRLQATLYAGQGQQDTLDAAGGAAARLELGSVGLVRAGLDVERTTEPRSSTNTPRDLRSPIQFDRLHLTGSAERSVTRLSVSGQIDFEHFSYDNGRTAAGATVFQGDRDRDVTRGEFRLGYAFTPATRLFGYASANVREYRLSPPAVGLNRDSQGFDSGVGARFDLSRLVFGEVSVGYFQQHYDDSRFAEVGGPSALGKATWLVTPLTTLSFNVERSVQDAQDVRARNFVTLNGSASIDHELLRNVLLNARLGVYRDTYEGIDRKDDHYLLQARATWLVNRRLGLSLRYSRTSEASRGLDRIPDFVVDVVSVAAVLQI